MNEVKVERQSVAPNGTKRYQAITLRADGSLSWHVHDLGPGPGVLMPGSTEYEYERKVDRAGVERLAASAGVDLTELPAWLDRTLPSDLQFQAKLEELGIESGFWSWLSSSDD